MLKPILTPEQFAIGRIEMLAGMVYLDEVRVPESKGERQHRRELVEMAAKLESNIDKKGRDLFLNVVTLNAYCLMLRHVRRRVLILTEIYKQKERQAHETEIPRPKKKGLNGGRASKRR